MGAGRFIRDIKKQVREGKKDKNKKRRSLPGAPAPRDKPKSKSKPKPKPKPNKVNGNMWVRQEND